MAGPARGAQNTLAARLTRELVTPLDSCRPVHGSPCAARLTARHLMRGEEREALRGLVDAQVHLELGHLASWHHTNSKSPRYLALDACRQQVLSAFNVAQHQA